MNEDKLKETNKMKKLMIAAAIVCAAAMSQAANLNWASYAYLNDGSLETDWFSGGQGYLVLVTDVANFAVADDLTITGGTLLEGEGSRNAYEYGSVANSIDGSLFGASDGQKYMFAILATNKGTSDALPTDGLYGVDGFYEITWNKDTGAGFSASEEHMAATVNSVGGTPGPTPTPTPVPEPTSGLLMVLGVAGLALRRRRA